ncbi:glycosyltransferase family 2 protein [Litoribacter alkaliphilus]|uniref:Glycosyltransferase family 2 protein n=1 Tax=Litoribacter ruber TaxID=702568 RepID=A0AAP2CLC2_9BACT|nr:glycosyltransferase family 2 protein [Litoribacter alkaliphilus]MBS9523962.1 glycosyltransferase family 2 protein [Litoribacter alkaliphilus]
MRPLVSVVICFFNEERYLGEAIQSVLNQSYPNLEIILVDDGSTDASRGIVENFMLAHKKKIRLVEHANGENRGLSASRNRGIHFARGEYVAFLDADDVYLPNYVSTQVEKMLNHKVSYICEATLYWEGNDNDQIVYVGAPSEQVYNPQELNQILYPLKTHAAPCMCAVMVKRESILRNDGFEESFTGMYEDQVFLSKLYYNEVGYISSSCNNFYRQRKDSMMSTVADRAKYIDIRRKFLYWFKSYLKEKRNENRIISTLLRKAILSIDYPRLYSAYNKLQVKFKLA